MKLVYNDATTGELVVTCSECNGDCCGQCDRFTEPPYSGCPVCMKRQADEQDAADAHADDMNKRLREDGF